MRAGFVRGQSLHSTPTRYQDFSPHSKHVFIKEKFIYFCFSLLQSLGLYHASCIALLPPKGCRGTLINPSVVASWDTWGASPQPYIFLHAACKGPHRKSQIGVITSVVGTNGSGCVDGKGLCAGGVGNTAIACCFIFCISADFTRLTPLGAMPTILFQHLLFSHQHSPATKPDSFAISAHFPVHQTASMTQSPSIIINSIGQCIVWPY